MIIFLIEFELNLIDKKFKIEKSENQRIMTIGQNEC